MSHRNSELFNNFLNNYWGYYRELEKEFLLTTKYVEVVEDNFSTFSIEFLKLYQAVCSEIDVVGKMMASHVNPSFNPEDKKNNIFKWWLEIQDVYIYIEDCRDTLKEGNFALQKKIQDAECIFLDSYKLNPWSQFWVETYIAKDNSCRYRTKAECAIPFWWLDYNNVKHNRTSVITGDSQKINYSKANLKNVSFAFSALYILEIAFMEAVGTQNDLEAFADYSELFVKRENTTTKDITEMWKKMIRK